MMVVIQRVKRASVSVDGQCISEIASGLLLLLGIETGDVSEDGAYLARKIAAMRVFPGRTPMDRSVRDIAGECLVVSQFTLVGNTQKGNRPSFERAEAPERARELYETFAQQLRDEGLRVATGRFAADMQVELVNDGPVTFVLERKARRAPDVDQ